MVGMSADVAVLDPVRRCLGGAAGAQQVRRVAGRIDPGRRSTPFDDQRDGSVGQAHGDPTVVINRSDKPNPPNCVGSSEWVAGCVAARIRLTPSDIRRNSDKNFWLGWNSF
jgi:hypothetical protein